MNILVVTASNGADHCQRALGIFARLMLRVHDLKVHLVCSRKAMEQATRAIKVPPFLLDRLITHFDIVDDGVDWSNDPEVYADGRLINWESRVADLLQVHDFQYVFSDNLCGVLRMRPDTILIGNFLWSDVLEQAFPSDPFVIDFVKKEREALKRCRPKLLCSSEVAMPSLLHRTQGIRCGFMVDPFVDQPMKTLQDDSYNLAVFSSLDIADPEVTADIVGSMHKRSSWNFWVEPECYEFLPTKDERLHCLSGEHQDFAKLDAVIAPPSFSILNECLTQNLPLIMYYSPMQTEKSHFAARIRQLKLGYDLGSALGAVSGMDAVKSMLTDRARSEWKVSRQKINCNGYEEAVTWIERYLRPNRY